jgi:hypothetical protein
LSYLSWRKTEFDGSVSKTIDYLWIVRSFLFLLGFKISESSGNQLTLDYSDNIPMLDVCFFSQVFILVNFLKSMTISSR